MPHITFINAKNINKESISKNLSNELSDIVKCPKDWFTFNFLSENHETYTCNGNSTNEIVFIKVEWFERPQEIKNAVAEILGNIVKEDNEVILTFTNLDKDSYYEY